MTQYSPLTSGFTFYSITGMLLLLPSRGADSRFRLRPRGRDLRLKETGSGKTDTGPANLSLTCIHTQLTIDDFV
jgi:hypothetical protein